MSQVKAIFNFRGRNEGELTILSGDILTVNSEENVDNYLWYKCKNEYGETGLVPSDRVQPIPRRTLVEQQDDIGDDFDNMNTQLMAQTQEIFPTQYNSFQSHRRSNGSSVSSSSFTSTNSSLSMPYMAYAPKYRGSDSQPINEWLNLVEMDMENIQSNQEKVGRLRTYLEGDAQSWYAQDIAKRYYSISWEQCKQEMIVRFSSNEVRPIIGAIHRVWQEGDTIKKYYKDKMTYLSQIDYMPDIDKVALLIYGMPLMSRVKFTAANLTTPLNWLNYGSQLETQLSFVCERRELPVRRLNKNNEIVAVTDLV